MNELQVEILETIGGWGFSFRSLYNQAKEFKGDKIRIPLNSWGGDAFQALLIHNYLKGHPAKVEIHIPAYAASAGTMIATAGDHVTIAENGYYMIHNPSGYTEGESSDMERSADLLNKLTADMVDMYHEKTKLPKETIAQMMAKETWLTAKEALALGFVDELTKGAKFQASADIAAFQNVPKELTKQNQNDNSFHQKSNNKMDEIKLVAGFLGLNSDVKFDAISDAIQDLRAKANRVPELEAKIKAFENAQKSAQAIEAESLIAAALTDSRISNEQVPHLREVFAANHETGKGLLATFTTKVVKISDYPKAEVKSAAATYEGKTFAQLDKENPKLLAQLKTSDPELWKAMFKAEYGVDFKE